jgi:hypothetical protein
LECFKFVELRPELSTQNNRQLDGNSHHVALLGLEKCAEHDVLVTVQFGLENLSIYVFVLSRVLCGHKQRRAVTALTFGYVRKNPGPVVNGVALGRGGVQCTRYKFGYTH